VTKLRVVEIYASFQGEGPNTSRPTVFVRFAGCNFKCPGWPCDTQHAIQPVQFTKLQKFYDPVDLAREVAAFKIGNVCLTGGEVFLQNAEALKEFLQALKDFTSHQTNVECFTNGALEWGDVDVVQNIDNFILDWKLPGSGEATAYDDNGGFRDNLRSLTQLDAIKFTIRDRADYESAKWRYRTDGDLIVSKDGPKIYAGVVWGALETETLAKWIIEDGLPWNLNVQTHKYVWDPNRQGV
jgi:7-carboxy-7-deazaguanine synthase